MANPKHSLRPTNITEVLFFLAYLFLSPYFLLYSVLRGEKYGEASDIGGALGEAYLIIAAVISGIFQLAILAIVLLVFTIWWVLQ